MQEEPEFHFVTFKWWGRSPAPPGADRPLPGARAAAAGKKGRGAEQGEVSVGRSQDVLAEVHAGRCASGRLPRGLSGDSSGVGG